MKVLLDEMLDPTIAEQLCRRGHDVAAIQGNAELEGKQDSELLQAARELDRATVTDNIADFARLHRQFLAAGEEHSGIVLASPASFPRSKRTLGIWIEAVATFLEGHEGESLRNTCTWLS